MFNIFIDELPSDYRGFKLKTDFKQVFKFFALQNDEELTEQEKVTLTLHCFYENPIESQELIDYLSYYISKGKEQKQDKDSATLFDWLHDNGAVYAAFMQVYKLDLLTVKMHWWTFLTLFENLPEGTKLSSIIQTRAMPIPKQDKYNVDYIRQLRKMKDFYSLEEKHKEIGDQIQDLFGVI